MAKYSLNLSFDIDINADEEEEISEEEMAKLISNLYLEDRYEFLENLRYYIEDKRVAYHLEIKPQKVYRDD